MHMGERQPSSCKESISRSMRLGQLDYPQGIPALFRNAEKGHPTRRVPLSCCCQPSEGSTALIILNASDMASRLA